MINDAAFMAHEAQLHLADVAGERNWSVDLDEGTFMFGGDLTFGVQLLGSTAPGPQSWLWAWANPESFSLNVLAAANRARAMGEHYSVPELTTGELPFEPDDREGLSIGYALTLAARVASGLWFSYSGATGGGSRAWMLLEGLQLPAATVVRTVRAISETLATGIVSDHRRAVASYAAYRQAPWDGHRMRLSDGAVAVGFDNLGRISQVDAQVTPSPSTG